MVLTFEDGGVAFDPVAVSDPELPGSIQEAKIGGLGLMLVRKAAADMRYERTPEGRNRLSVTLAVK